MRPKSKICSSCGRSFDFRKKWEKNWESVKFCSAECRKNKNRFDYTGRIMKLLSSRPLDVSICPSEVLVGDEKQDSVLMEHVRRSARLLVEQGKIVITQKGRVVDPSDFKGPIRLRLKVGV